MKICKVFHSDYPWEIRIEKILNALIGKRHEVHLVCRNLKNRKKLENVNGLKIRRLSFFNNSLLLNNVLSFPAFFNPIWLYSIYKVVKGNNIDIIMVRDLPLALASIFIGRLLNVPVIYDMAENYPAMWQEVSYRKINYLIKNPFFGKSIERLSVRLANHVIVVVEESKNRLVNMGISSSKITIVSNTPNLEIFSKNHKTSFSQKNRLIILYVGNVSRARGLDVAIKAMPNLKKRIDNLYMFIVGSGNYLENLKKLAKELGLENDIIFTGWVHSKQVPSYIYESDICIIPHYCTEHKNTTIPNKIFDFMACGKPVIVSDARPLKRIVNQENCGIVFKSGSVEDFTNKFLVLLDPSKRMEMGKNGRKAVENKYNWEIDSKKLDSLFR